MSSLKKKQKNVLNNSGFTQSGMMSVVSLTNVKVADGWNQVSAD